MGSPVHAETVRASAASKIVLTALAAVLVVCASIAFVFSNGAAPLDQPATQLNAAESQLNAAESQLKAPPAPATNMDDDAVPSELPAGITGSYYYFNVPVCRTSSLPGFAGMNKCFAESTCNGQSCTWTTQWACPGKPRGTKGFASADGSTGYQCCCLPQDKRSTTCGGTQIADMMGVKLYVDGKSVFWKTTNGIMGGRRATGDRRWGLGGPYCKTSDVYMPICKGSKEQCPGMTCLGTYGVWPVQKTLWVHLTGSAWQTLQSELT